MIGSPTNLDELSFDVKSYTANTVALLSAGGWLLVLGARQQLAVGPPSCCTAA